MVLIKSLTTSLRRKNSAHQIIYHFFAKAKNSAHQIIYQR
eukprot:UN06229